MNIKTSVINLHKNSTLAWMICICAALFFSYELMQFHLLNAISSHLMKDLHISASHFGILGSTYLLADVLFLIPAGIILDRYPVRKVILSALLVCIIGTVGFACSTNFIQACFAHFLSGIGNAFCFLCCIMLVSRWFTSDKQAFVIGIVVTIGMLGGVIAQAPFNYLATLCNWREAMMIDAALGIAIFFAIFFIVKDSPDQTSLLEKKFNIKVFAKEIGDCFRSSQNFFCGLYTALTNLPLMIIGAAFGSLFLSQIHGFNPSTSSLITSLICMGTILGSTIFGYLSDKIGQRKPLMLIGALLSLIIILSMITIRNLHPYVMGLLFFNLGFFSSTQVLSYPLITQASPKHLVGTSMSISAVIIMGLAGVFQIISGKLLDMGWCGKIIDGIPIYSSTDFLRAFIIFPIGFIIAAASIKYIKEKKGVE